MIIYLFIFNFGNVGKSKNAIESLEIFGIDYSDPIDSIEVCPAMPSAWHALPFGSSMDG